MDITYIKICIKNKRMDRSVSMRLFIIEITKNCVADNKADNKWEKHHYAF